MEYENDRRAGNTHPEKREMLEPNDPRVVGRRYAPNRRDRRSWGDKKGFSHPAAYRRVRSLRTLMLGPYKPKRAR